MCKDSETTQYASQEQVKSSGLGTLGYEGKQLYISSIKHELEMRRTKLHMELELVDTALRDCTPEVEQTLRLARTLDKLGMRPRV